MPFAIINDHRIEYRMIPGSTGRVPLVLLHEGLGSAELWRDFPDKLARRLGARTLVYSRLGYGRSDPSPGPRRTDFMHGEALRELPALLDRLAFDRPLLVGHSDGASIALIHAALSGRPVAGLALMAPHVFVEELTLSSIARIRARFASSDLRQRLAKYHDHVDDAFLGWADTWLDPDFRFWSITAELGRITCPLLLIQGENDEYGTLAQLDEIEKRVPATRLVLPRCGHAPHRDQESAVLDAIARFHGELGPSGQGN